MILALILPLYAIKAKSLNEEENRKFNYFFMEANRLKMKGEFQKAAEMYNNCIMTDPESAVSHYELGKILLMASDEKTAIELFQKAAALNPKNDWYQLYLARVYEHGKKFEEAIDVYKKLKADTPSNIECYYQLGSLYTQTKQYNEAIAIYTELEQLEGMDENIILEKQRLHILAGNTKDALKEINRLIDKFPKEARYIIILGDYYRDIKNYKKAIKAYNKATELDPDNGFLHLSLSIYYELMSDSINSMKEMKIAFDSKEILYEQKMQILIQYMMMATEGKANKDDIDRLNEIVVDNHPEEPNTYFIYANYLIEDSSKIDIVIENLEKVIELEPSNEEVWAQLMQISFQKNNFAKALQYSDKAESNNIHSSRLYLFRGIAAQHQKETEKAKIAYEAGIKITENNSPIKAQILGNLGDVYFELKDSKKAFESYESALSLNPHSTMVLNNYAYYLSEEDTLLEKAESMSAKCIELEPGNGTFLDTYAWILYKRGSFLLSKFYMEQAINNIKENNYVLFDHYGDILWENNNNGKAIEYWQKAIDAGGNESIIKPKMLRK